MNTHLTFYNHQEEIDAVAVALADKARFPRKPSASEIEASKAFASMFPGETHAVYVVSYNLRRPDYSLHRPGGIPVVAQEFFPANTSPAGVNRGLQDARETFADEDEPSYSKASYINCIELLPSGHWKPVQLFRSE